MRAGGVLDELEDPHLGIGGRVGDGPDDAFGSEWADRVGQAITAAGDLADAERHQVILVHLIRIG